MLFRHYAITGLFEIAMEILKYGEYEGSAVVDMDRGVCRGKVLYINDLVTYEAENPKLLQKEFEAAVDDYIETCKEVGKEPQRAFKGVFNVRVAPELHREAVRRSDAEGCSLNELMGNALNAYLAPCNVVHHEHKHDVRLAVELADGKIESRLVLANEPDEWTKAQYAH